MVRFRCKITQLWLGKSHVLAENILVRGAKATIAFHGTLPAGKTATGNYKIPMFSAMKNHWKNSKWRNKTPTFGAYKGVEYTVTRRNKTPTSGA